MRLYRPFILALVTLALTATAAFAWQAPLLEAQCASSDESLSFTITLAEEENQRIEISFDIGFEHSVVTDFETAGAHQIDVARPAPNEGMTLYVRYESDHEASAQAEGNTTLCGPAVAPTPKPTPAPLPSPLPSPLAPPASPLLPDTSLAMDAGQPETFTPNWPAGIAAFVLVLVIGLPVAWKLTGDR